MKHFPSTRPRVDQQRSTRISFVQSCSECSSRGTCVFVIMIINYDYKWKRDRHEVFDVWSHIRAAFTRCCNTVARELRVTGLQNGLGLSIFPPLPKLRPIFALFPFPSLQKTFSSPTPPTLPLSSFSPANRLARLRCQRRVVTSR